MVSLAPVIVLTARRGSRLAGPRGRPARLMKKRAMRWRASKEYERGLEARGPARLLPADGP